MLTSNYNLETKTEMESFYQDTDGYREMLTRLKKEDFQEYIFLVRQWLPKGSTYLDLGCGLGQTSFYLNSAGYKVKGVDISKKFITEAKKNSPEVYFYQADALNLPFPDESFDGTGSHCVIEHISDIPKFLKEQIRVTKKGGLIFIYAPNLLSPLLPIKAFLFHSKKTFEGQKTVMELIKIFFRNIKLVLRKKIKKEPNFIYRRPIFEEIWPDYDACYYTCPVDLKNFFEKRGCQILYYQRLTSANVKKSIFQKLGSRLLPNWMGIIRIIARK